MKAGLADTNKLQERKKGTVAYLDLVDIADCVVELDRAALLKVGLLGRAAV